MRKYRYVVSSASAFACFILYWCMIEINVIVVAKKNIIQNYSPEEIIVKLLTHQGSYVDTFAIIVFTFLFCICLNGIIKPVSNIIILRMTSRYAYIISCLKNLIVWSVLFSAINTVVNIILVSIFFDYQTMSNLNYFQNSLISCINLILYFSCTGGFLILFNILFNSNFAHQK